MRARRGGGGAAASARPLPSFPCARLSLRSLAPRPLTSPPSAYFGEARDTERMLAVLQPMHAQLERGAETEAEAAFEAAYGPALRVAAERCAAYVRSGCEGELKVAWERYFAVLRLLTQELADTRLIELRHASPRLFAARDLELAVPGTYRARCPVISICAFQPSLQVMSTKQRPRKLQLLGSDGRCHTFLLKGREDLRQDERVAQLFLLVNNLLSSGAQTHDPSFQVVRYAVVPLSTNSGLLRWVPRSDTLHALVREYRLPRNILLNIEHRLMLHMAPDYELLPLMHKVEVRPQRQTHFCTPRRPIRRRSRAADRSPCRAAPSPRPRLRAGLRARARLDERRRPLPRDALALALVGGVAAQAHDIHALARSLLDGRPRPRARRQA